MGSCIKGLQRSGRLGNRSTWESEVKRLTSLRPHDSAGQPLPPSFMTLVKSPEPTGGERTPTGCSLTSTRVHLDTKEIMNNYNQNT